MVGRVPEEGARGRGLSRPRLAAAALLLAAAAAGGFALLSDAPQGSAEPGALPATAEPRPEPAPGTAESDAARAPAAPGGRPATAEDPAPEAPTRSSIDDDAAYLTVRVLRSADGEPVEGALIRSRNSGQERQISAWFVEHSNATEDYERARIAWQWDETVSRTGREGQANLELPPGFPFEITARHTDPQIGPASQWIDPLAPGERRTIELWMTLGYDRVFFGQSIDPQQGPIAGATVRLFEGPAVRAEERSDEQGFFTVSAHSWHSPYLRIEAEGYVPELVAVVPGHEDLESARRIPLERAAALELELEGTIEDGMEFVARGGHDYSGHSARPTWAAPITPDGSTILEDLPSREVLEVWVRDESGLTLRPAEEVVLDPGETRRLHWSLPPLVTLRGVLIDQEGLPVPDCPVALEEGSGAEGVVPGAVRSALGTWEVFDETRTDSAGEFVFEGVPFGRWLVGCDMHYDFSDPIEPQPVAAIPTDALCASRTVVDLDGRESEVYVEVTTYRGLSITGRVVDAEGKPVERALLSAYSFDLNGTMGYSGDDGRFALGPLLPGEYSIRAGNLMGPGGSTPSSGPVSARAGARGVVIRIPEPKTLTGTVTWEAAEVESVDVFCSPIGPLMAFDSVHRTLTAPGPFELPGLGAGRYQLEARGGGQRLFAGRVIVLEPEREPEPIELRLVESGWLFVRITDPRVTGGGKEAWLRCYADGVTIWEESATRNAEPHLTLPAGPALVRYECAGEPAVERSVFIEAGRTSEVEF